MHEVNIVAAGVFMNILSGFIQLVLVFVVAEILHWISLRAVA